MINEWSRFGFIFEYYVGTVFYFYHKYECKTPYNQRKRHFQLCEPEPLVHTHNVKIRLADCCIVLIGWKLRIYFLGLSTILENNLAYPNWPERAQWLFTLLPVIFVLFFAEANFKTLTFSRYPSLTSNYIKMSNIT